MITIFLKKSKFSMALDGLQTSQDTSGVQANLKYSPVLDYKHALESV